MHTLRFILITLVLVLQAQPVCAQDCDGDSISDAAEYGPFFPDHGSGISLFGLADNARATIPATDFSLANQSFTIEFWLLRNFASGDEQYILFNGNETINQGLVIGFRADQRFTFAFWGNDLNTVGQYPPDGQWHHWVCRYDATTNQRWIIRDGVEVAFDIASSDYAGPTGPFMLGGLPTRAGLNGTIDELRIWDGVRTDTQLVQNMFVQYDQIGIPAGLHAFYPFNPDSLGADLAGGNPLTVPGLFLPFVYQTDCNNNGIPDNCDILSGFSQDCNLNGIPDECDTDCNANGIPDLCDIISGFSQDCNGNLIPDDCDIASGLSQDCNNNGIPDECDLSSGLSQDCNNNGIPDECDINSGLSQDCNNNGILDECDLLSGTSIDCNTNGIPDECDILSGMSTDTNADGRPDECDAIHNTTDDTYWSSLPPAMIDASNNSELLLQQGNYEWPVFAVFKSLNFVGTDPDNMDTVRATQLSSMNAQFPASGFYTYTFNGVSFAGSFRTSNDDLTLWFDQCHISATFFGSDSFSYFQISRSVIEPTPMDSRLFKPFITDVVVPDVSFLPRATITNSIIQDVDTIVGVPCPFGVDDPMIGMTVSFNNCILINTRQLFSHCYPDQLNSGFEFVSLNNSIVIRDPAKPLGTDNISFPIQSSMITLDTSLFMDPDGPDDDPMTYEDNDYRHALGAPSIDSGDDLIVSLDFFDDDNDTIIFEPTPFDFLGNPRFVNTVDMGPYEYQGPPPCQADLNNDGLLDFFDISAFLTAFSTQDPIADFNNDTLFDFFDISAFLTAYGAGCP